MSESVAASDSPAEGAPRIAVIVPAYGVAHLVGEALASLQAQTFPHWECVVIDDGAPDDVAAAVAPFLADSRIRFLRTDNGGVAVARNRAISSCTAPLLTMLDGDDRLRPDYLATLVPLMEQQPDITIASCKARLFGAVTGERFCFAAPTAGGNLANVLDRSFRIYVGSMFRRADWQRVGGFDGSFRVCEDFDLWVRLLLDGGRACHVDQVLADYRVRPGSASADSLRMLHGNLRVYEKAQQMLPPTAAEQALLRTLIAATREAIAFEQAIDHVVNGDRRRGLADLAQLRWQASGPVWRASFVLWRFAPALARPMLRWRRRRHSRGYQPRNLAYLLRRRPAA